MTKKRIPTIAISYDFDGTLSPGNMQEFNYIPDLKMKPKQFWEAVKEEAKSQDADEILVYMCMMLEKAHASRSVQITRESFADFGQRVELFKGVEDWFTRINAFGTLNGASIEHYIISSGIKEMIEGTTIAGYFKRIYASSFIYEQHGIARWPGLAINYTNKTQFLFRINKGVLDVWDNKKVNAYIPMEDRPVPFSRMIYVGDGSTDIPCMKLVKDQGGYSIAVYRPHSRKDTAKVLIKENRVNFTCPADYTDGSNLDKQVKAVIQKMVAEFRVENGI